MTHLKRIGLLCLILILLLPAAALASSADTVYLIIGGTEITANTSTDDYTFTFTSTSYPRAGTLAVKDGGSVPAIQSNAMELTIEVKGTATIENIDMTIPGQTYRPMTVHITGGGTLNIPSGYIGADSGLQILDGTTVNVTNPNGSAVFVQKNQLSVYEGSKLNAVTTAADSAAITLQDAYQILVIGEGSVINARGGKYGIYNYNWANSGVTGSVSVRNGAYLEASGSDYSLLNRYWGEDDSDNGSLVVDENSSVKLSGKLVTALKLPESYEYKTGAGSSAMLAPYDGTASTGNYLEIKGRTVYVPVLSRTPDDAAITLGDTQTYSISTSTVPAPAGTAYEWSVNGTVQSETGSSFTFAGSALGAHTIQCRVTVPIDGKNYSITHQKKVTVQPIDASSASVTGMEYYCWDNLTPTVTLNGKTLTPGTDYIMQWEYMGSTMQLSHGLQLFYTPIETPVTFLFRGDYQGSTTQTLKIKPIPLSRTTVTLSFDSVPYNGLHQKPAVASITYNGHTFKEIVSFVSQGDYYIPLNLLPTINPGSYSIAIESSGSYLTGKVNAPYTITKATPDVDAGTLSFTYGDMFSGPSALTWNAPGNPTPLTLTEGTDYTYTSPTGRVGDVGTRTGTIAFAGDLYSGTDSFSYSVSPKEITADNISLTNADFVYNGADQLPAFDVKVKLGDDAADTTLVSGTDYTVAITRGGQPFTEVKAAGTYTVVVSGVNNYTGSVSYTCHVDRLPLADGDAMLASDQLAWTGDPCSPTIAVRKVLAGGALTVLAEGADYEVQWLKGADAASAVPIAEEQLTDLGDYFALITGIGNYQSSIAVPFRIVRANTAGSGADSYLGEAAEDEFVFGQTITIRLSPESDGTVAALTSRLLRSLAEPVSGDDTMTLYLGSVQLTQPVSPDANGVYTASVSTLHSAFTDAVTQLPATITLTASFSGNSRLAGRTFDLPVTITPAPLTVPQVEGVNRGYREGNRTVRISAVTLSGMLAPYDDVQADIASLEADVDSDQIGVYTKAHFDLSAPIALKGEHSGYYDVPALRFTADTNVMIFGPPVIIDPTEPVEKKAYNNHSAVLSVTAEGEELSYQWYKVENGVETPLADGEEYTGVTSPALRINRVEPRSTTQYICRVTNDAGSDEAQFTVIALTPPPTGDKANPAMWLMLLVVSLIGLCTLRRRAVKA